MSRSWAPLTGLAFLVFVIIAAIVAGEPPDADSPVEEIVDHYVDNEGSVIVGAALSAVAALFLVFFGGYLRAVLREAEGPGGVLSPLVLAGTVIIAVGGTIDATISIALAGAVEDIEPSAVQALQALWDNDFLPILLGTQVFVISTGLSIVRHGALPKWLGWVLLVIAVLGFTPIGFIALFGAALWVGVVSVMLAARGRPATA
jgi:hypothetical protein